ncbi:MAG TPA: arylamine N-acetyltransferase [Thermoanaerobaculia bacterium]|nr:arylamine N-acetyltransferase [Thermoanaerobaculia bacterium]
MIPPDRIEEILEALEIDRADPSPGYLEALFSRFNQRVLFESASKIVRDSEIADPAEKPRWPEVFWADHIDSGAGGTCFARVAAFRALIAALGFDCRPVLGRVQEDFDHAAVLVESGGERWICDVGFPLPALLPTREGETETASSTVAVARAPRGFSVELLDGVPEGPRSLEIFEADVPEEEFRAKWRSTFQRRTKFLTSVSIRVERPGRNVSFAAGEIRVDDRHSRTRIPLAAPRAAALGEQFGVDAGLLDRAFSLAGDPEPSISAAEITAYLETAASPRDAFSAIGTREAYIEFQSGAGRAAAEELSGGEWRVRLSPEETKDESAVVEETVTPDPEALGLRIRRGAQESAYEVSVRNGRTFLLRRLVLSGPRLDLLRNDSLRGRLAGSLAVDLLAWARRIGR